MPWKLSSLFLILDWMNFDFKFAGTLRVGNRLFNKRIWLAMVGRHCEIIFLFSSVSILFVGWRELFCGSLSLYIRYLVLHIRDYWSNLCHLVVDLSVVGLPLQWRFCSGVWALISLIGILEGLLFLLILVGSVSSFLFQIFISVQFEMMGILGPCWHWFKIFPLVSTSLVPMLLDSLSILDRLLSNPKCRYFITRRLFVGRSLLRIFYIVQQPIYFAIHLIDTVQALVELSLSSTLFFAYGIWSIANRSTILLPPSLHQLIFFEIIHSIQLFDGRVVGQLLTIGNVVE